VRVLHLLSSAGFYGAEAMAAELVRQLHRKGVTVDLGVFDNAGRGDRRILDVAAPYIQEGIVIPCRGQIDASAIANLRGYVKRRAPDVIHSHAYKTTFYALLARWRTSCRLVATYHNWLTHTATLRFYMALDKRLARYCDAAVAVSGEVALALRPHIPPERLHRIGNGIDSDVYRRATPVADAKRALGLGDRFLVGFVGRLSSKKGLSYLLRALATLPPAVHAVIVGDGDYREAIVREAELLNLSERVHLLGVRDDVRPIYAALDIFVLPSESEAFPMVVLEAMASGLPVVATDVGDTKQIVEDGLSGRVVPARDADALARALSEFINDRERALRIGAAARQRVEACFSSAQMAGAYLGLYESVLPPRTRA
jgi:glycosyltransferase involved in cell wall biosynthesis